MGGIVKSITNAVKDVVGGVQKGVGGLLGSPQAPQVTMPEASAPAAAAAPSAAPTGPTSDMDQGLSSGEAQRRGKRGLTIARTKAGSGQGLNV